MASVVNVQDPSTLNNLAVNSSGQIGISNLPAVQTVQGTVNVAFFPANQVVSGSIDVTDRSTRQLGIVTVASGTIGTNTSPAYNIIQDATTNANKLKVNSDGSINALITTESVVIGSVELVDSGGVNKASISAGGALKVDNSAVTQPVSGTFWQATQPVSGAVTVNAGTNLNTSLLALETGGNLASIATNTATPNVSDRWARQVGQIDIARVLGSAIGNTNPVPSQDIEQSGYIAATSPPATTNAGSDTSYTFSSQVNRVIIQNNTSANVNYAFDTTASAGSLRLVPSATLIYPKKCTVLHLFTAAAQNINGSTAGNLVVLGAL